MTDPRRQPEDIERLLSEKERQLSAANRELEQKSRDIEQLEQDVKTLAHWSKTLDAGVSALLDSRRWKMGNTITELGRRAMFRPEVPTVMDDLNVIGESFRAWREEFDARRFEQAKGRPGAIETGDPQALTLGADETSIDSTNGAASVASLSAAPGRWRFESAEHILDDLRNLRPVTVVVPIYNAHEDLKSCLESVVRNTTAPAELLLIDDASPDPRIAPLLAEYEALENVRVLTNDENLGFVSTVNRALSESDGDVVLLNSDAEVTPRWLENLTLAAYADPRTATVTAISDNAGAFSVPVIGKANETPKGLDRDETGRLVMQQSGQIYPQAPTGSGFCMYIKRAVLDEVGLLDAESFPRGYGEENDFCMRAQKRGWNHVVDDATFIFHERMASFGGEKKEALKTGREMLDKLHPEYTKLARVFVSSEDMKRVGDNVRAAYGNAESGRVRAKPRVLFVLHRAGGGTHYTTQDLMGALAGGYSPYVLVSDGLRLKLFRHGSEGPVLMEEWTLRRKWRITEFSRPDYRDIVFRLLVKYRFELVHIRHLMGHTFDLPEIAAQLRIPVVLSFHDFYLSCPTTQLIDNNGKYCGGVCTPGRGLCRLPKVLVGDVPENLKNDWLKTWRLHVERMFEHVDAFLTTSFDAREVHLRSLPGLRDRRFEVIEHGRDLEQAHLAVSPGEGPIRLLIPGNIEAHKGAEFLRELQRIDAENRIEFHFLGNVVPRFQDLGVMHGPYERGEFNDRVREIGPSFIGIFSIWPETYCHTLTEAWATGVPVLVSDIGTLRERVNAHGGGWLLDHEDPRRSYERILEIAHDKEIYSRELERANLHGIKTVKEMGDDYEELYEDVRREHRSFKRVS
ncbi:MAG: glycosyltransferase [Rubrobacter sp.]|nr:glycosyltransferase [Rubrobacter sp.]